MSASDLHGHPSLQHTSLTSQSSTQPNIAVIGGGPGGLVALLTLLNRGVQATLYERENSSNARAHLGGMLDLTWNEGQRALRENGLADAFETNSRLEGQENRICGKEGIPLARRTEDDVPDETKARPEIDRRVLRKILLTAIPAGAIKWGHALASVRPLEDGTGRHELTFANGLVVVSDYLIGADGASARSCPRPRPSTTTSTASRSPSPPRSLRCPRTRTSARPSGWAAATAPKTGRFCPASATATGALRVYVWYRGPLECALPRESRALRRAVHEMYAGWAPWAHKIVDLCDEDAIYHTSRRSHPCLRTGSSSRTAAADGLEIGLVLAEAVRKGWGVEEREAAVAVLEERLSEQAKVFAELSYNNVNLAFAEDAPRPLVDALLAMGADAKQLLRT
ncbi:FAD/NAD(P)-binding domain-containing protein [Lentinus brumalis]|uniref:FAD/NAD(P)-binding domain-containing protein n=1 Tax=Lentinus brumalis TaxID=2498619 RepID=A0A371CJS6_9APHY|nr:FAD/NAD(P)-binding domain-containing protein [Polyporus brumalis]